MTPETIDKLWQIGGPLLLFAVAAAWYILKQDARYDARIKEIAERLDDVNEKRVADAQEAGKALLKMNQDQNEIMRESNKAMIELREELRRRDER